MGTHLRAIYISAGRSGTGLEVKDGAGPLVLTDPAESGLSLPPRPDLFNWQRWFNGVFELFDLAERYAALGDKFDEVGRRLGPSEENTR